MNNPKYIPDAWLLFKTDKQEIKNNNIKNTFSLNQAKQLKESEAIIKQKLIDYHNERKAKETVKPFNKDYLFQK